MNKNNSSLIEQIEKYLQDELGHDEKVAFEEKIESNPNLKEDVEWTKRSIQGIENIGVRETIQAIHYENKSDNQRKLRFLVVGMAASILFFLCFWFLIRTPQSNEELFVEYFEPYPDAISIRNSAENENLGGLIFYTSGDYKKAIEAFEKIDNKGKYEVDIQFYRGLSYMATGSFTEPIKIFSDLLQQNTKYDPQVRWYLALSYLMQNDSVSATRFLNEIKPDNFKYKEAQSLLTKVK